MVQWSRGRKIVLSSLVKIITKSPIENVESTTSLTEKEVAVALNENSRARYKWRIAHVKHIEYFSGRRKMASVKNERKKRTRKLLKCRSRGVQRLFENGTFKVVNMDDTEEENQIFWSRFKKSVKLRSVGVRYESRPVPQIYRDYESTTNVTGVRTV